MSTWSRRAMWPWGVTRSWYHVGRPSMLEGKTFLGATGIPIWKIARVRIRFAVWLPEPLTVAAWMVRSLMIWLVTWSSAADCEFYAHVRSEPGVQAADWLQSTTCEGRHPQGDRARRTPGGARPRLRDQACRRRPRGQRRVGRRVGGRHHRRGLPAGRCQDRRGRRRPDGRGGRGAQGPGSFGLRGRAVEERRGPDQLLAARHQGDIVRALAKRGVTAFSLELVPRISRAQSMDALSSQASAAGYKAVLMAAGRLGKFFPMMMTAAGTIPPARVLVMGAGVAGLQAIATARRLGAVVSAYDVRPAVKEEVQSLGATFIELALETQEGEGGYAKEQSEEFLRKQRELIGEHVAKSDVVITTAAVPGRRAPLLVTGDMVKGMRPGSVIVDLAADTGGNVELTKAGEDVEVGGVTIIGTRNVPSTMPLHASQLYARNVANLLLHLVKDGAIVLDFEDEITKGCCVTHGGEIVNERAKQLLSAAV